MRHLGTQVLITERLILRPLTAADAIAMFENWASDPQVTRFLRWEPHKDWLETAQLLAGWEPFTKTRTTTSGAFACAVRTRPSAASA